MRTVRHVRRGVTLIEVLLVIAILAVLMGLLLVAIQRARDSAALVQNKNNLRQTILATHQEAGLNEGKIENLMRSSMPPVATRADASLFNRLLPLVHGPQVYNPNMTPQQIQDTFSPKDVKVYHNLADPSWDYDPAYTNLGCKCSYVLNMFAMDGSVDLVGSLPDGTSQTIAFTDHYFARCSPNLSVAQTYIIFDQIFDPYVDPWDGREVYGRRRPTFADRGWEDVLPVTDLTTKTTRPSVPGKTFQVQPRPEQLDPSIPSTPYQVGLTVAMFDGSVRTIAPSVSETVFWGLVTPAGGEVVNAE